jgi:hypothetical protein
MLSWVGGLARFLRLGQGELPLTWGAGMEIGARKSGNGNDLRLEPPFMGGRRTWSYQAGATARYDGPGNTRNPFFNFWKLENKRPA